MKTIIIAASLLLTMPSAMSTSAPETTVWSSAQSSSGGRMYIYCHNGVQHTTDSLYRPTFDRATNSAGQAVKCIDTSIYKIHRDESGAEVITKIK